MSTTTSDPNSPDTGAYTWLTSDSGTSNYYGYIGGKDHTTPDTSTYLTRLASAAASGTFNLEDTGLGASDTITAIVLHIYGMDPGSSVVSADINIDGSSLGSMSVGLTSGAGWRTAASWTGLSIAGDKMAAATLALTKNTGVGASATVYAAWLEISFTAGAGAPEMDVVGGSTPLIIVSGSTSPDPAYGTDFGSRAIGSSVDSTTLEVWNTGDADLHLTGSPAVQIGGTNAGDFSVQTQPSATLGTTTPTDRSAFVIRFTPSALGVRTATVSIANDDSDENPYTFDIQGTGVGAILCRRTLGPKVGKRGGW